MTTAELLIAAYVSGLGLTTIAVLPAFGPDKYHLAAVFGLFWPISVPIVVIAKLVARK